MKLEYSAMFGWSQLNQGGRQVTEKATGVAATKQRRLDRNGIIAIVIVALLLIGGGTVFGVNAYRDKQATEAAEELVALVTTERERTDAALATYSAELTEAQGAVGQLTTINELVQARIDVFEEASVAAFGEAVSAFETQLDETAEPDSQIDELFTKTGWDEAFIHQYREGNADERDTLEAQVQQAIASLGEVRNEAERASQRLIEDVVNTRHSAVYLAEQLPTKAEALIATYNEAASDTQVAVREASNIQHLDEVSDENLEMIVNDLSEQLIVYIETVDQLTASHNTAVAEREAAEAAAAAAAANSGGGGGGSGGGGLCNRWTWLGMVLEPC